MFHLPCSIKISIGDAARAIDDALLTLRYDLLARLHADGLLQDLQPVQHCIEGTAVRRRHAIDDVRLAAQDGVAAVLSLACEGLIAVDINRPILPETQVRRRRLPYSDPFAF